MYDMISLEERADRGKNLRELQPNTVFFWQNTSLSPQV